MTSHSLHIVSTSQFSCIVSRVCMYVYRYVIEMILEKSNTTITLMADILCGLPQFDPLQTPLAHFNGRHGNERDVGSGEIRL